MGVRGLTGGGQRDLARAAALRVARDDLRRRAGGVPRHRGSGRARRRRRPPAQDVPLAGAGALVPDRAARRAGRDDRDRRLLLRRRRLRLASGRLGPSARRSRRGVRHPAGSLPARGGGRLDGVLPGAVAPPLQRAEADGRRRVLLGGVARARLLRRRGLGPRAGDLGRGLLRDRVRPALLRPSLDCVAVLPGRPQRARGRRLPRQLRRHDQRSLERADPRFGRGAVHHPQRGDRGRRRGGHRRGARPLREQMRRRVLSGA